MTILNHIFHGEAALMLKTFPPNSIDAVVTSPPYWALRDYGVAGQLGLEPTFDEYVSRLCDIFDEVKRVLKPQGTCWVNLGDTYFGGGRNAGNTKTLSAKQASNRGANFQPVHWQQKFPTKSLCLVPSRFAIEMCNRGWILRNEIIWHKPNVMPSSATDRFTVDFEYLFFFTKSKKYFFDKQYEKYAPASDVRYRQALRASRSYNTKAPYKNNTPYSKKYKRGTGSVASRGEDADGLVVGGNNPLGRNKRAVWAIPTKPFPGAHFATFPEELVRVPIEAGCPSMICAKCGVARAKLFKRFEVSRGESSTKYDTKESTAGRLAQKRQAYRALGFENPPAPEFIGYSDCGCNAGFNAGVVLDPFFGAGTTGLAALKLGRNFVGIELNPDYVRLATERLAPLLKSQKIIPFEPIEGLRKAA